MILLSNRSLFTNYRSCHNAEAADEQQSDPQPHHTVIAGLRRLKISGGLIGILRIRSGCTNIALAGIALAIVVSVCVSSLAVLDDNATTCYAFSLVIFLLILF